MLLADKIQAIQTATDNVKGHPLCLHFHQSPHYYLVEFPYEVQGIGGVRVAKNNRKLESLNRLYNKLEEFWKLDNQWWLEA